MAVTADNMTDTQAKRDAFLDALIKMDAAGQLTEQQSKALKSNYNSGKLTGAENYRLGAYYGALGDPAIIKAGDEKRYGYAPGGSGSPTMGRGMLSTGPGSNYNPNSEPADDVLYAKQNLNVGTGVVTYTNPFTGERLGASRNGTDNEFVNLEFRRSEYDPAYGLTGQDRIDAYRAAAQSGEYHPTQGGIIGRTASYYNSLQDGTREPNVSEQSAQQEQAQAQQPSGVKPWTGMSQQELLDNGYVRENQNGTGYVYQKGFSNPFAPEGALGHFTNDAGDLVAIMPGDNGEKYHAIIRDRNGMLNLDYYGKGIYDEGSNYQRNEYVDAQRDTKYAGSVDANLEMGVYDRPDLTDTQFQGAYLPYMPDNAADLEKYHNYYTENPELRNLLSVDEQQQLLFLDAGTQGWTKKEYKNASYDWRNSLGLPRKTGLKGSDHPWEWRVGGRQYKDVLKGADPYQALLDNQGNIGGWTDRDKENKSFFEKVLSNPIGQFAVGSIITAATGGLGGLATGILTKAGVQGATALAIANTAGSIVQDQLVQRAGELGNSTPDQANDILNAVMRNAILEAGEGYIGGDDIPTQIMGPGGIYDITNIEKPPTGLPADEPEATTESTDSSSSESGGGGGTDAPEPTEDTSGGGAPSGGTEEPLEEEFPGGLEQQPGDYGGYSDSNPPPSGTVVSPNVIWQKGESEPTWTHTNPDGTVVAGDNEGDVWEVPAGEEDTTLPGGFWDFSTAIPEYRSPDGSNTVNPYDGSIDRGAYQGDTTDGGTEAGDPGTGTPNQDGNGDGNNGGDGEGDKNGDDDGDGNRDGDGEGDGFGGGAFMAGGGMLAAAVQKSELFDYTKINPALAAVLGPYARPNTVHTKGTRE